MGERQSLFGRYSYQHFEQTAPAAFGAQAGGPSLSGNRFSGTSEARNQSVAIGYTRTINPTFVNDFRFGYMRYRVNVLPGDIGAATAQEAGIPGLNLDSVLHVRNSLLPDRKRQHGCGDRHRLFARREWL